jgi:hypothetical protein
VTRVRIITVGGALLVGLVLVVLAALLLDSQAQDREDVRKRFNVAADVATSVTNGIFRASLTGVTQQASEQLGGPQLTDAQVQELAGRGQLVYAAALDSRGREVASTPKAPEEYGDAVDTALETGKARLSDAMHMGSQMVVEWAIPYQSAAGDRFYVQGIPASSFADFLEGALGDLRELPEFEDAGTVMIDGKGIVLGGVGADAEVGEKLHDAELLAALEEEENGTYGDDRYFASGAIDGSPFKIVLSANESDLYASIPSSRKTVPWIIFAAFALAAIAGLLLMRRALGAAAELERRELNERHAVEINDNIIQGLALAKYQLQRGQDEASAAQVSDTLREAQRLVSGLLGDAEVQAGQLRRESPAETRRPDEGGGEPKA